MEPGCRQVVHRAHWFDGNSWFYDSVPANDSKVDLSIRGHRVFKDGSPINVPTGENSVCITGDAENKMAAIHTSHADAITGIRRWSVFGEVNHGILADFKVTTGLRSSRVAFWFSFRHFWKTVAQIIKGQLRLTHI